MDYLNLITPEDMATFAETYDYGSSNFMGQKLFPAIKTDNLKVKMHQLADKNRVPVMAQVHAFDTEARIGSREDYTTFESEKLLIKEKINQGEEIRYFLDSLNGKESEVMDFIYDDLGRLLSRCMTRVEVADMELLATGKLTISENGVDTVVDYGFDEANRKVALTGWADPNHDILGSLRMVKAKAVSLGFKVVRAITSSKIIGYLLNNKAIQDYWKRSSSAPITDMGVLGWLNTFFGIEFITNDAVYKTDGKSAKTYRFFDEDTITFLSTRGTVGTGIFGKTPEEFLIATPVKEKQFCTLSMWETPDAATIWSKATAVYLPTMFDADSIIAKIVS